MTANNQELRAGSHRRCSCDSCQESEEEISKCTICSQSNDFIHYTSAWYALRIVYQVEEVMPELTKQVTCQGLTKAARGAAQAPNADSCHSYAGLAIDSLKINAAPDR